MKSLRSGPTIVLTLGYSLKLGLGRSIHCGSKDSVSLINSIIYKQQRSVIQNTIKQCVIIYNLVAHVTERKTEL